MAVHAASRSVPRSPAPREDWLERAREGLEPIQALTARLQRLTAPGGNVTSAQREKIDRIVRSDIEQHLGSPAFEWFVERRRPRPRRRRRDRRLGYGREDRAAPVALLRDDLRVLMGGRSPVAVLTDWVAGKQYWRHGEGMLAAQIDRGRVVDDVQVPVAWYAEIQGMIDAVTPKRASDLYPKKAAVKPRMANRWEFRRGGRVLVLERRDDGILEVLAYYPRLGQP